MTILLYVRRKEWNLRSVSVECSHERVHCRDSEECEESDQAFIDLIRRHIYIDGDLTEAQRDRISYIARRCPIHRTLEAGPHIEDELHLVNLGT